MVCRFKAGNIICVTANGCYQDFKFFVNGWEKTIWNKHFGSYLKMYAFF
jgi:hypothetical protein